MLLVLVSGCASVPRVPSSQYESAGQAYARLRDSIDVVRSLKPDEVVAAPRIRLVIPSATLATSQYVNAAFQVSADAYVLVVAVDQDRRLRVLFPESPQQSGFAAQKSVHRLPSFFAGFGHASQASRIDAMYSSQLISPMAGVGLLLAVASDRPLQLDRLLDASGEWDEQTLQSLVYDQSLAGAAHALGRATVLTGQDYNVDYSTLGGSRALNGYGTLASRGFDACGYGNGFDSFGKFMPGTFSTRLVGMFVRNGVSVARYASGYACGDVSYYDVTVGPAQLTPRDTARRDSTVRQMRPPKTGNVPREPSAPPRLTRLDPSDALDGVHDRPIVSSGVRFRRPEQIPAPGIRPLEREPSSSEPDDMSMRRRPHDEQRTTQPLAPRSEDQESARSAPVQREPMRTEPARSEPARSEPVRSEPVRSEPVRSEPARSEPARSEPVRSEPARAVPVQREPTPVIPPPLD